MNILYSLMAFFTTKIAKFDVKLYYLHFRTVSKSQPHVNDIIMGVIVGQTFLKQCFHIFYHFFPFSFLDYLSLVIDNYNQTFFLFQCLISLQKSSQQSLTRNVKFRRKTCFSVRHLIFFPKKSTLWCHIEVIFF